MNNSYAIEVYQGVKHEVTHKDTIIPKLRNGCHRRRAASGANCPAAEIRKEKQNRHEVLLEELTMAVKTGTMKQVKKATERLAKEFGNLNPKSKSNDREQATPKSMQNKRSSLEKGKRGMEEKKSTNLNSEKETSDESEDDKKKKRKKRR
ncbi:uncharacterized protein MELLADRAFT_108177 [Melampsora larici-populina 98AG31]|uniref:Uncharacterized protein n=1 Tax=Melampsora larici-populina (strain 98AG31 / pathotype 3-4-7) TaxID=747676 RepID=F4RS84_MELLP|nr:uncharacterized protein MELLADRAFT_108177 [Melampsora larici-populina 98AG31]EGG04811.1 hypothetical protein MELLADRAFT_108177 [Melampsora larici-populina 98AG31]